MRRASSAAHGQSCCEAELGAPSVEREPAGDVQQPVAQPLGLGFGELAVEQQRLGPDDQVVREQHDLKPHLVERERLERELRQAGVLVVADAVLDVRVLAVAALDDGDVLVGLVGEDRLEAVAVVVGERQLRAGVRALAAHDQPASPRGQADRSTLSVISATSPFSRSRAVLVERRNPGILGDLEDRGADRLGQLVADREAQVRLAAVVDQPVRGAGGVGAHEDLAATRCTRPGSAPSARSSTVM